MHIQPDRGPANRAVFLSRLLRTLSERDAPGPAWHCVIFLLAALALFTRRPGLLLHPQFYSEDGSVWYAQAYNGGWLHSLALPEGGYLNTLQRLVAGLSLLLPFAWAPALMVMAGLLIQLLPLMILMSARARSWGLLPLRLLFGLIYIVLPNTGEIHVVLTNAQWHWALAMVLLAFAAPPQGWGGRVLDGVVMVVGGLSGPFCIVLCPLTLVYARLRRQKWSMAMGVLLGMAALTQGLMLIFGPVRQHEYLGATFRLLLRLFGGDVVQQMLFAGHGLIFMTPAVVNLVSVALGLGIYSYCLRSANLEMKLLVICCVLLFAASLRSPLISGTTPDWVLLLGNPGARYWFFPELALAWGATWCVARGQSKVFRIAGYFILLVMPYGVVRDWVYHPYRDEHFAASVQRLADARPGEPVTIPIIPDRKMMELIKKER